MKSRYPLMSVLLLLAMAIAAEGQGNPPATASNAGQSTTSQSTAATQPDPLLDPAPLPQTPVTLVGGVVRKVDGIRDRLVINIFGGGAMKLNFDDRSHIYRDGMETTVLGIHPGDRVYVDTQLDKQNGYVFARNIRVVTKAGQADTSGQVLDYDARNGAIRVLDRLSGQPMSFRLGQDTVITRQGQRAPASDLVPGTLVTVKFSANRPDRGTADQVDILAKPGGTFTFTGRVTFLDLRSGLLAIDNAADGKNYSVYVRRGQVSPTLVIGSHVTVKAEFDGRSYRAEEVKVNSGPQESKNNGGDGAEQP